MAAVIGSILFISFGGIMMASSLNMHSNTSYTISTPYSAVTAVFSSNENIVKNESIQLEIIIENKQQKTVEYTVYPTIIFSEMHVYNGTTIVVSLPPHDSQQFHQNIPFREIGKNSLFMIVKSNDTDTAIDKSSRLKDFNVISQERDYQIQDQQFYYSLAGLIAIPVVISTIKNLKDIISK
jgi:hypothetical protein